jgi:demethylmenaquinone methyltransferase/2-methoxy-6-polyprenyl-1,4-benzoquinol methylase
MDQVVGVDLLPGMISLARSKARAKGLDGGTNLVLGDALMLPFPSNTFACATSGFSLRNMPDLQEALAEMVRVVRPGGRVTTLELTPMDNSVSSMMKRWFFHRIVPLIGQVVARDRAAYTYLPQSVDYFPGAERLEGLLTELGLINVGYTKLGMGSVTLHWGDVPSA